MKKFKHVIPFLLAMIMALAIPLAGCNSCGNKGKGNNGEEPVTLESISVDASNAKTQYYIADGNDDDNEFTSKGLIVTAILSDSENPVTLSADDYVVDSSDFNNTVSGKYTIKVSYTYEDVTKEDSYSVTVYPNRFGLKVTLVPGTQDTFTLSAPPANTVEIDTTKIIVSEIAEDGTEKEATGYTTKLFRGQEEIPLSSDGKATVTGGGAYAIWAEKAPDAVYDYARNGFVLIYVDDAMTAFAMNDGGVFEQQSGIDAISKTWSFTATYVSGTKREISIDDCQFYLDTIVIGENKRATITYIDYTATGKSTTKTVDVRYTITPAYGKTTYIFNHSAIDNTLIENDKTQLTQDDLKGENSFLKLAGGSVIYKSKEKFGTGAEVLEIKGAAFYVTFAGTGKISIGASSTGGSNDSDIALQNTSTGKFLATSSTVGVKESKTSNVYVVSGTSAVILTFEITTPGTYAIVASTDITGRGTRLVSVEMEDNVEAPAKTAKNVYYIDDKRFN